MSTVRLEAVATDAKQDIPMQPASVDIWDKKYRLKTKQGQALDADIDGTYKRVAKALAGAQLDERLGGASFAELPESLRRQGLAGVLVEDVQRGSRAAQNGLQRGDVVLAASSGQFSDLTGFRAAVSAQPQQLVLQVLRGQSSGRLLMR